MVSEKMQGELKELVNLTKEYLLLLKGKGVTEVTAAENAVVAETLKDYCNKIKNCQQCELAKTRTNFVFGEGPDDARLVFVGEAPGYDEDREGRPFVGRAGKLLTKIILAMGLLREEVYICNILKCRPPNNRSPLPNEINTCRPYLVNQLSLLKQKRVICALGRYGAQGLLQQDLPMYKMRGQWYDYESTPVMVTYHPAYLLRNPSAKNEVWQDVKKVRDKCLRK